MRYNIPDLKKQLKPGDVFLVHGTHVMSRIIRVVTDSHWNHATMYVGNGNFIEANNYGVKARSVDAYKEKDIEVYRHKKIMGWQRKRIVAHALSKIGRGYDFFQILQLFFYYLFGFRGNAREIGRGNKYICSELVAESYIKSGLQVYKKYNASQISPGDFPQSEHFVLCVQRKGVLFLK